MEIIKSLNLFLSLPLVGIIWFYQRTISPDHGLFKVFYPYGYCKFHPTCSEYAKQVLLKDGLTGLPKIISRLISCRPSSLGGVDLP